MFKSVYVKYIMTFMLIIVVSMSLLAAIVGTLVSNYSETTKYDAVETVAKSLSDNLGKRLRRAIITDLKVYYQEYRDDTDDLMRLLNSTSTSNVTIIVADSGGNIIFSMVDNDDSVNNVPQISKSIMDEVNNGIELSRRDTLEGVFDTPHLIYASPVYLRDNYVCGTVFVCSASATFDTFIEVIIKTVTISSLWVMLAALIAIYFISERIIYPLKEMSRAAKSFAAGHFDIRVPVRGKDEVAELATAFNNMAQSLESLDEMRNNFMSSVSHDMRTPMTTISGFIDCIISGAIPPEKHEYYLRVIKDEVQRLSRLVATLLDISRIQAGDRKFVMAPFDVCEMGRQVLISFEQKIDNKNLEVEFDADSDNMFVIGDHDAIYQILYNIVDNAVKFSRESGVLKLSVKATDKDKKVRVSVYNEGDGIPYEDQPYIFERFFKSDKSRGKDKSGVGLGMFISKAIIEAHNEEIGLRSEPGEFCEFFFTLAVAQPDSKNKNYPSGQTGTQL